MDIPPTLYTLLLATGIGYLLGAIPMAAMVSRARGVDIFSTGPGLAGAANVFRNVGPLHGVVVFAGDAAKGILAVIAAHKLGLEGDVVFLPALAAVAGHWWSPFTHFRGGDAMATLIGITVALLPLYGLLAVLAGAVFAAIALARGHHAALWGGTAGYGFLLLGIPVTSADPTTVVGIVILALMVLLHGVVGHRRREASA